MVDEFLGAFRPVRDVARLAAEVVGLARAESASGSDGFAQWCARACAALADRSGEAAALVGRLRAAPQRALLFSTALLHGARADAVYAGASRLLEVSAHPYQPRHPLEGADLTERLAAVDAAIGPDGRVAFAGPGIDTAVRTHLWRHLPELRTHLLAWTQQQLGTQALTDSERSALAGRFAAVCLEADMPEPVGELAERCASAAGPRGNTFTTTQRAAVQLLGHGLDHERHGAFFRQRVYQWAQSSQGRGLTDVLVLVCTQVMAVRHPEQAVVRLHHLARHERGGKGACKALGRLAAVDRGVLRLALRRIADAASRNGGHAQADAELFLELADPAALTGAGAGHQPLVDEPELRGHLTVGWSVVFDACAPRVWRQHAGAWFQASAPSDAPTAFTVSPHDGVSPPRGWDDRLLGVLTDGCGRRPDRLGLLYAAARDWAAAAPQAGPDEGAARRAVLLHLRLRIDAAQGYRPSPPAPAGTAPGPRPHGPTTGGHAREAKEVRL